ncbi:discoidin domain-containing protein [Diaminobutyricibacter sp. McL0608]|uniref:discoidin domain-containing protein n=1 Tax=Leifsonia sp. McL0608 TaxID=3143537 RepID=UPI0031F2EC6C
MTGDIVVKLETGTYLVGSTFQLAESGTIHDSGTNGFTIRYEADAGATPLFSGERSITNFTVSSGTGTSTIYQASLPSADFPSNFNSRDLYVNGVRAIRARSSINPAGFSVGDDINTPAWTVATTGEFTGIASWSNQSDMEIVSQHSWKLNRYEISSISGSTATMATAGWTDAFTQAGYHPDNSGVSWVENAKAFLDAPGEWYLDRTAHTLYYMPRAGENLSTANVDFGGTPELVDGAGSSATPLHNVTFDGITFEYDSWIGPNDGSGYADFQSGAIYHAPGDWANANYETPAGVSFEYAAYVTVKNCTFSHMSNAAVSFGAGVKDSRIDSNAFSDIGGNGIDLGGITVADHTPTDAAAITRNDTVSNNTITTVGAAYYDNSAIAVGYTQAADIAHNTLHNLPYTGITLGWGWGYEDTLGAPIPKNNLVRGNQIYDFNKALNDGGGIYTLGDQPGTMVVDNYIYGDVLQYSNLYRDNGSGFITDTNNVVSKVGTSMNTWYFTNVGSGGYWNAHDNVSQGNYFSAGMTNSGASGQNTVGSNTSVAMSGGVYQWPTGALNVIDQSGVGGANITPVGEVPLSQGKAATASSMYSSTYDASKAVDGDSTTRWAQASGAADPSWLQVDLGATYSITRINTAAYMMSGHGMKYKIESSTDGTTWADYATHTAQYTAPAEDMPAGQVLARYVRITFIDTQHQGGSIYQFDVYGTSPPPLSQGKTATASSIYSSTYDASKAVDGDTTTRWAQASGAADPSWLEVDLGANHSVTSITTLAYLTNPVRYKIEYSTDNSSWTSFADHQGTDTTPGTDAAPGGSVTARYLRITLTNTHSQGGSIYEFDVNGT